LLIRLIIVFCLLVPALIFPTGIASQESEVLCCRPVCSGCGSGSTVCEYKSPDECHAMGGWSVEDCTECD
jgi:hypothetical protein